LCGLQMCMTAKGWHFVCLFYFTSNFYLCHWLNHTFNKFNFFLS
jgi:hypothetical protein